VIGSNPTVPWHGVIKHGDVTINDQDYMLVVPLIHDEQMQLTQIRMVTDQDDGDYCGWQSCWQYDEYEGVPTRV
jgi:hypothetical protein